MSLCDLETLTTDGLSEVDAVADCFLGNVGIAGLGLAFFTADMELERDVVDPLSGAGLCMYIYICVCVCEGRGRER